MYMCRLLSSCQGNPSTYHLIRSIHPTHPSFSIPDQKMSRTVRWVESWRIPNIRVPAILMLPFKSTMKSTKKTCLVSCKLLNYVCTSMRHVWPTNPRPKRSCISCKLRYSLLTCQKVSLLDFSCSWKGESRSWKHRRDDKVIKTWLNFDEKLLLERVGHPILPKPMPSISYQIPGVFIQFNFLCHRN